MGMGLGYGHALQMRLLYVIPGLGGGGGAEQSLASMIPVWTRSIDVHVAGFSTRRSLDDSMESHGAQIHQLCPKSRTATVGQLRSLIDRLSPDLVHTTLFDADIVGRVAALSKRTPVSSSLVNVNYGKLQRSMPGISAAKLLAAQGVDIVSSRAVVRFHALTHDTAATMGSRLLVPASRIEVIPRGRDRALLGDNNPERRQRVRVALGVGDRPLIVAAARHEWQKGLDVLLQAVPIVAAQHPDVLLLVGGRDGAATDYLHDLVSRLRIERNVKFIGPRGDVPDLMCASDVFCVPSRWEGFGSILVEAMALGIPTVASDIPPIREVSGDAGWINMFESEHPSSLAAEVLAVLDRPDETRARSFRGISQFDNEFASDTVSQRMLDFFTAAQSRSRLTKR